MKRMTIIVAVVGLTTVAPTATPSQASSGVKYRDYLGVDSTIRPAAATTAPGAELVVAPHAASVATPGIGAALQAAATAKVTPTPRQPIKPQRLKAGHAMAANTFATNSTSTTVCNFSPNLLSANPLPPASGTSFAVAKAINGTPYSRSGKSAGIFQGGQGYASSSGLSASTTSRTSTAEAGMTLSIGSGWPAGSSIQFWFNPILRGRGSTQSVLSPLYSDSTTTVEERIDSGAGVSTEINYQNMWDMALTNSSGVGQTTPTWVWNGLANGGFYYREVPISIAGTYKFSLRSTTTVSATSVIGGAAAADMDFGSDILDTPANLSPTNFGILPNASTATGQPYNHVTIAY